MQFAVVARTGLGNCIEKRVPAAHVGAERMPHPDAITQMDPVCLAGTTAVGVIFSSDRNAAKTQCSM